MRVAFCVRGDIWRFLLCCFAMLCSAVLCGERSCVLLQYFVGTYGASICVACFLYQRIICRDLNCSVEACLPKSNGKKSLVLLIDVLRSDTQVSFCVAHLCKSFVLCDVLRNLASLLRLVHENKETLFSVILKNPLAYLSRPFVKTFVFTVIFREFFGSVATK
jgi:hypothetical protein